ncbi:DUF4124 domain-containing protein [Propionivibrio limicola]|uniref:DUF4124 domain-containing protein n=1 Tax=Propionivibrio limicola TaxID=167645 RepID=UPI001291FDE2|nr:DUF4124 domain-containing protein [Propionivibrio limicola]
MKHIALIIMALSASMAASAQIYQWKDEKGKTVISDIPPSGRVTSQQTHQNNANPSPASPSTSKTLAEKELEFRKRQQEVKDKAVKNQKEEAENSAKKENCENARRQLQALESGERIVLRDDKGERYFMEDAQREQEIAKLHHYTRSNCR